MLSNSITGQRMIHVFVNSLSIPTDTFVILVVCDAFFLVVRSGLLRSSYGCGVADDDGYK